MPQHLCDKAPYERLALVGWPAQPGHPLAMTHSKDAATILWSEEQRPSASRCKGVHCSSAQYILEEIAKWQRLHSSP